MEGENRQKRRSSSAAKLQKKKAKLFFCEPPNTVTEKDNYFAVGAGAAVTDPLYETLFWNNGGDHTNVQEILRRVSYLIYRAKKDSAFCGKRTEACAVGRDREGPWVVEWDDLKIAEEAGKQLDFILSSAAVMLFRATMPL